MNQWTFKQMLTFNWVKRLSDFWVGHFALMWDKLGYSYEFTRKTYLLFLGGYPRVAMLITRRIGWKPGIFLEAISRLINREICHGSKASYEPVI